VTDLKRIFSLLSLILIGCFLLSVFSGCSSVLTADSLDSPHDAPFTEYENGIFPHPAKDNVLNILVVGSSVAARFPDELVGMLTADGGQKVRVCHAYSSGLTLKTQWEWLRGGTGHYELRTFDSHGMRVETEMTLGKILLRERWDVISFHQTPMEFRTGVTEDARKSCIYASSLYDLARETHPDARYLWYQIWGFQVGYQGPNNVEDYASYPDKYKILTKEKQTAMYEAAKIVAGEMCQAHKADRVPAGDAWQIARSEPLIGDTLCGRDGNSHGDYQHDGDTGGGQYLNACVWYEILTGKSCIGHPWRPSYELSEDKIPLLQAAAHQAVAEAGTAS